MAPHGATETGHPKRDQRTDALDPVGHPIADCESAKQRRIWAMTGRVHDLTAKFL